MNVKALSITLLGLTTLIFWGNHYAARSDAQSNVDCPKDCNCQIVVDTNRTRGRDPEIYKKESCSLIFRKQNGKLVTENLADPSPSSPARFGVSCGVTVFCGQSKRAFVSCSNKRFIYVVNSNTKCSLYCMPGGKTATSCEVWKKGQKNNSTSPGEQGRMEMPSIWSLASATMNSLFIPTNFDEISIQDNDPKEFITTLARWRPLGSEAGFDKNTFTVAKGEAEVRSFCTGDTIRLAGPNVITLPTCAVDITGLWKGAYSRRMPLETGPPVEIALDLRNESNVLKGELKTPDGTFPITSASQNNTSFQLEAQGTVAGKPRKFVLNGRISKGDIVFDGAESGIVEKPLKFLGVVRRMYIADTGLPPAVLNQSYNFKLTTVSPDHEPITFRLASGSLPPGITFDGSSGTLSGTPSAAGTFKIRVAANDVAGNAFEQPFTLDVKKMMITNRLLPDAFYGQSYSATLGAVGGHPPYRYSGYVGKGFTLNPTTGEISGTPVSTRSEDSWVTIQDNKSNSETQQIRLRVRGTTILTSHFLADATQGSPYSMQFVGVGSNIGSRWQLSSENDQLLVSSLGLTFSPTGELSGTPVKTGQFQISVGAVTTSSDQQYREFTFTVHPPAK